MCTCYIQFFVHCLVPTTDEIFRVVGAFSSVQVKKNKLKSMKNHANNKGWSTLNNPRKIENSSKCILHKLFCRLTNATTIKLQMRSGC